MHLGLIHLPCYGYNLVHFSPFSLILTTLDTATRGDDRFDSCSKLVNKTMAFHGDEEVRCFFPSVTPHTGSYDFTPQPR